MIEYILSQGNPNVILCERGIRTFEKMTRNTLDISAIPMMKHLTHLPIMADPSQGTGRRDLVTPLSLLSSLQLARFPLRQRSTESASSPG